MLCFEHHLTSAFGTHIHQEWIKEVHRHLQYNARAVVICFVHINMLNVMHELKSVVLHFF